ncbi:MAG: molybdenum cofactor biosynthesis protein MoaE [Brevundimonas sp.]|uniref:molybdenum cofactor biosynthesis protein MoaE n=1 Tax=Brevundimonas sp. TaxID=1871086 RepID=UPI00258D0FC7|nr:molybdenum cofactor biosynthesis protein MoaE [Brevundimonas sp.]MCV0416313.1 molybdenum cofactor biosynthesis protein MoaE [Brevundimonas sp.]
MISITQDALDVGRLLETFCKDRDQTGAVVSFVGLTRAGAPGAAVDRLTLQAYPTFTEAVMREIEAEARQRFDVQDILAVHRWGAVGVGEQIIFVAVAARHRRAAFEACDYLMDQFKTRAPFWKKEEGPDGARWIEARDQDHRDLDRWTDKEDE